MLLLSFLSQKYLRKYDRSIGRNVQKEASFYQKNVFIIITYYYDQNLHKLSQTKYHTDTIFLSYVFPKISSKM